MLRYTTWKKTLGYVETMIHYAKQWFITPEQSYGTQKCYITLNNVTLPRKTKPSTARRPVGRRLLFRKFDRNHSHST